MTFPLTKKNYDVIVIGAGPAGSLAAKYAALGGADVLLADKKREIGTPIQCAGFIPDASEIEDLIPGMTLPDEMKALPKKCVLSKTTKQRLYAPDLKMKEFDVLGYVLDRRLFDNDLAEQAVTAGADLLCGTRATAIMSDPSRDKEHTVRLTGVFGEVEVTGKIIIGADGPSSFVGKTFGLVHHKNNHKNNPKNNHKNNHNNPKNKTDGAAGIAGAPVGPPFERAIGFEYKMTNVDTDENALEMFFGNQYVPGGYVWIFPEGKGKANVGLGLRRSLCTENISARALLNRFIREHPVAAEKLSRGKVMSVHSGVIPVDGAPEKTATNSVIITGDAAGQVMATNGGGIPFAMAAGKIAGEVAAAAVLKDKRGGGLSVAGYEEKWRAAFGESLAASVQARKMMDKFMGSDKMINAAFKILPAEKLKEMQCGHLPDSLRVALNLMMK
ncbi:MAG: FAD-dependent monooxygenase [Methanimicrococcus sp.]|nr:FAD-dependent monooxygenase [Methanimicrococcus sp.]